jgi:hypothetical protein
LYQLMAQLSRPQHKYISALVAPHYLLTSVSRQELL